MWSKYIAPIFRFPRRRIVELDFSGQVGANTQLTIVAGSVPYPFMVLGAKMYFVMESANRVLHYWLISRNRDTSTTALPSGDNIFSRENPLSYFVGKAFVKEIESRVRFEDTGLFIKLHTINNNAYACDINASIEIQEI